MGAIGYMIPSETGPVAVLSGEWGLATAATAVEAMYNALQPEDGPRTRAHIRRVS